MKNILKRTSVVAFILVMVIIIGSYCSAIFNKEVILTKRKEIETTFNWDNFVEYLTTDDYNTIKDYSKSVIQTGVTLYGGYSLLESGASLIKSVTVGSSTVPIVNVPNVNGTLSTVTVNIPTLSVNTALVNQALIEAATGTAAISTNGSSNNGNNYNEPKPDNPKKMDDKYLKKNGVDPHKLKKDTLGDGIRNSDYNIYVDKNGEMWLQKDGSKNYVPTYENIKSYK